MVYALLWIYFADRAARKNETSSATFHGITATAISFPLLWETTVKFHPAITMLFLGFPTATLPPFLSALILLAATTVWLGYRQKWFFLAGFVALVVDFGVFASIAVGTRRSDFSLVFHGAEYLVGAASVPIADSNGSTFLRF